MSFTIHCNNYQELLYILDNWMAMKEVSQKGIYPHIVFGIPENKISYSK